MIVLAVLPASRAIGQSPASSPEAGPDPASYFLSDEGALLSGYLVTDSTAAVFLQWTTAGDRVSGTITRAFIDGADGVNLGHDSTGFSGITGGQQLSIDLDSTFGSTVRWTGLFSGEDLIVSYPGSNGSIATMTLMPATVNDYNLAVSALMDQVAEARRQAAIAADLAARRDRVDGAAQQVSGDIDSLDQAIGDLESARDELAADSRELRRDGQTARAATVEVLSQARTHPKGDGSEVCWLADGVSFDADTVDFDVDTVMSTVDSVQAGIEEVDRLRVALQLLMTPTCRGGHGGDAATMPVGRPTSDRGESTPFNVQPTHAPLPKRTVARRVSAGRWRRGREGAGSTRRPGRRRGLASGVRLSQRTLRAAWVSSPGGPRCRRW